MGEFVGESGGVPSDIPIFASLLHGLVSAASPESRRIANTPAPILVASLTLAERARASITIEPGPTQSADTRVAPTASIRRGVSPQDVTATAHSDPQQRASVSAALSTQVPTGSGPAPWRTMRRMVASKDAFATAVPQPHQQALAPAVPAPCTPPLVPGRCPRQGVQDNGVAVSAGHGAPRPIGRWSALLHRRLQEVKVLVGGSPGGVRLGLQWWSNGRASIKDANCAGLPLLPLVNAWLLEAFEPLGLDSAWTSLVLWNGA